MPSRRLRPSAGAACAWRIPSASNPQQHTRIERARRRWTRRFFATAVASILLLGALVVGPATVAASLDILMQIDDQFTPPSPSAPPPRPSRMGASPRVAPSADPVDD